MMQTSLFETDLSEPLASRLRPLTLDTYVGQKHLVAQGKILWQLIEHDHIPSMIFWGPPGVGKTTLARVIAHSTKADFVDFSAVTSSIKDIKTVMKRAEEKRQMGIKTIVFVDEIHRFNKAQQDAFLPFVERGSIILIGATTENPSFEINSALLSRCKVFVLNSLETEDILALLKYALTADKGYGQQNIQISDENLYHIASFANGDARMALNTLEMIILNTVANEDGAYIVSSQMIEQCTNRSSFLYDKKGEEHYNIISALHKSMRNSDVDASIYWMSRMLEAGEDPLYIARRLIRFASEDIGMADSRALEIAIAGYQACHFLGYPECDVHLTHVVTYLSLSVKSNALDKAYNKAKKDALETLSLPVPLHLRNAPTKLMKDLDYGKGYQYAHDYEDKITTMTCLPEELLDRVYYEPTQQGAEAKVLTRLNQIKDWKKRHR
jgi:ATPase related to the helicase subunit of the Holliday junction resolvase